MYASHRKRIRERLWKAGYFQILNGVHQTFMKDNITLRVFYHYKNGSVHTTMEVTKCIKR